MYKLTNTSAVTRLTDGAIIPFAEGNADYAEYLAWIADGNTPTPANTPEELVAIRWEQIKSLRDSLTDSGGCLVSGKWFHTDTKSKQQQMALVISGQNIPQGLQWKTMDGSFTTMTPTLAQALFAAQIAREQIIFTHAEMLKADPEADINEGWPERYEVQP